MLQKACLPSCCLPSSLILKASGKLFEEALSAYASVLRRRDQNCVFHHKYAISPYKGSYESIYMFTPVSSPPCLDALRAGRCHMFGFLPVLTSFHSQPGWTAVLHLPSPSALQLQSHLTVSGRKVASPGGLWDGDFICWLMWIPQRDSSQQRLVMSHGTQPRVTRHLGQAHRGTTLCFPIPGQIPSLLCTMNNIYLLEELHRFLWS